MVARDITKKNVSQLEVAWTYPDRRRTRLPVQPHHRRQRHVRAGQEQLAGGHRRGHAQGTVDPRQPARHHQSRHQLLGEPRSQGPPPAVRARGHAAGHRCAHRQIHPVVRQERRRRSARRPGPRSGHRAARGLGDAGTRLREPADPRQLAGRGLFLGAGTHPRLRRDHAASWPGPFTPFRSRANSATTPGRRTRGNTPAA